MTGARRPVAAPGAPGRHMRCPRAGERPGTASAGRRPETANSRARDPEAILAAASRTLDFTRPVGLMMLGDPGSIWDDEEAYAIRDRLVEALAPGSCLVFEDGTNAINREAADAAEKPAPKAETRTGCGTASR